MNFYYIFTLVDDHITQNMSVRARLEDIGLMVIDESFALRVGLLTGVIALLLHEWRVQIKNESVDSHRSPMADRDLLPGDK